MEFSVSEVEDFCSPADYEFRRGLYSGIGGRLAYSTSAGAGNWRIFAIGNYVHQRLLRPLHDFLMRVLACLPTDGTFDQLRPLDRLKGKIDVYSFDLKSATDRWPLSLQSAIVTSFFGRPVGECVHTILSNALFDVPFLDPEVCCEASFELKSKSSW